MPMQLTNFTTTNNTNPSRHLPGMSTITIEKAEAWMRIMGSLHHGGAQALCGLWADTKMTGLPFSVTGLQASQKQLFDKLDKIRDAKGKRIAERYIMKHMVPLVFPASGFTDVHKFDVTLHTALLLNMTAIKPTPNLPKFELDDPTCLETLFRT